MVYSPKEKYVFNKIVKIDDSETVIWETKNETEHFHRVYVDGLGTFSKTKNMSLHLCNGTFIHLNGSDSGPWSESPGVVDLDVRISNSNIQVDFFKKDNFRIYAAKPGYTIRKVIKSKKCTSDCCSSPKVIWEAHKEHALKVVLMGTKKEPKHLAVLMKSGELTLLFKSGKGEPWEDITSSKNNITDLKMYAMADDGKSVELHKGHYSITLFNEFYGYVFYEGVGCVKVAYKGKNIWDLKEEHDFGCLKGVFLDLKSNKFNVMNDDDRYWLCEEVRKVKPVTLDVSSKASTDDFDFTVDHNRNIMVYTSKGNAMFYQVVKRSSTNCCGSTCCDSETVIWETEDPKGYASKVFADGVGACSSTKNVSIYLLNGDILHFGKGGRNEPWKPSDNKITLDVDKTSSTIGYDFVHHGETRTFTVKPGYQFKTVKLGSSWKWLVCGSSCCNSGCLGDFTFWNARTDWECSTKVTVYGVETNVKNINIFLNNNKVEHYHKVNGEWVSKTSIVLDIDKNKDNDLFDYRSTRNYGHFNPKANLAITMIVKKSLEIWTAQPDDHGLKAVLMGSGKDEKFISILLQSGNFVLLRKSGQGQPWEDITQEKSDFSGIKMYSLEEGTSNYHLLTENDYDPIVFESRYGHEFKDSVKCVKITYNDKLLWSHTEDAEFGYLKGLYLDLPKNQFSVTNLKDQTKKVDIKVTLDIEKTEGTSEFSYSDQNGVVTYTPKPGHVFSKVFQGSKDICEFKTYVCGTLVRTKTEDNMKYLVVLMTNNMFKLFQELDDTWNDITSDRHDVKKLKFLGDNDTEITSSDYKVKLVDLSFSYTFNDGVKCLKITYDDKNLWKHTDDSRFSEIKSFHLGLASNSFYVKNSSMFKKLEFKPTPETAAVTTTVSVAKPAFTTIALDIEKKESTDEFEFSDQSGIVTYTAKSSHVFNKITQDTKEIWQSKDGICGTLVRAKTVDSVKYMVVLMTNKMFTVFHLYGGKPWSEITSERHDVSKLKFFGENDTELKSSDYIVTIVDLSFTYLFNDGVNCKKIKLAHDDVWKNSDDTKFESIKSFRLGLISNNFYVLNNENVSKKLEFKPTPETAAVITKVSVTKPTKVTLDIEKTETTDEFDYTEQNGLITFTPKDNHLFNKVSQGTKVIWQSKDGVFGTLVRTKTSKSVKYLVVLLTNNMFTVFHLDDNEWKDITSDRHDITKLKFLGENDTELSKTDFTVTIVDLSFTYIFNSGVSCKKIKLRDDEVWKHTDDASFADIKSFSLGLASNSFFVKNQSDEVKKIEKELETVPEDEGEGEGETKTEAPETPGLDTISVITSEPSQEAEAEAETETTPDTSVTKPNITIDSLDLNATQTTTDFEYSKSSDFHKYTPKTGYVFSRVSKSTTVIWESKDDLYGTEVMFIEGVKYLTILLQNNNFVLFEHHNDKWHDITSKRHDVTKVKFFGENNVELTKSDYNVSFVDFFYRLKFNTNVKCVRITYNNNELWSHTDDPKFAEITLFSLGLASNSFFVKSMSGHCKKLPEPAVPTKQQPAEPAESTQQATSTQQSTEAEDSAQAESAETDTSAQPAEPNQPAETDPSEQSTTDTSSASSS